MNPITRRKSRGLYLGGVKVGGGAPISIQSMTNTKTADVVGTLAQISRLAAAGCDICRLAVPDMESADVLDAIIKESRLPIVADIHFDYRLALECVAAGIDKIRINPGNIGDDYRVGKVAKACRDRNIPIRTGINSGSLEKNILAKHGAPTADALVESAMYHIKLLNKFDFDDIVLSVKSSDVSTMITAYENLAKITNYPLHLGVTEAGTIKSGIAKSAMGIGYLLLNGIGDTIRVSLTADPLEEISAAYDILKFTGYKTGRPEIISCPTCGRTQTDLVSLTHEVECRALKLKKEIKIAVMGCAVNGPGEAKTADFGICGASDCAVVIKKGEIIKKVPYENAADELFLLIENSGE